MKRRQRVKDKTILYAPHTTWLRWSDVKINIKCVIVQKNNVGTVPMKRLRENRTMETSNDTRSALKCTKQSADLEIGSEPQKLRLKADNLNFAHP